MGPEKAAQEATKRRSGRIALANKRLDRQGTDLAAFYEKVAAQKIADAYFPSFCGEKIMQLTTTPNIEGKHVTKYCGVIAGEAILGANLFKDLFAGIRDLVGGRSGTYERELQRAREIALEELTQRAVDLGANAVIGIDIDYEIMGKENGMLMVSASGTAVVVE
jgi:uncharacterized protein YbjQ (UPF0145 family)